ncbi:Oligosaccharide translocation protein rft1 [Savitreella phatthalungensis]
MSVLKTSLIGTSYLIVLQLCTKVLTFSLNQLVLRYTSPAVLGLATVQLELLLNTALFLCREGFRLAAQRIAVSEQRERQSRQVVTLSVIPLLFGVIATPVLTILYLRNASQESLATPYFTHSAILYAFASVIELLSEPAYNLALQSLAFRRRAVCEGFAVVARCIIVFLSARSLGLAGGALPFAYGQLTYAIVLTAAYAITTELHTPQMSSLDRSLLSFALGQTVSGMLKYLLTEGDKIIVSLFNTNTEQGIYGLAANYGGLLARIVFQPVEEASRSYFSNAVRQNDRSDERTAYLVYALLLRLYAVAGCFALGYAPRVLGLILPRLLHGSQWIAVTPVLQAYCRYLPILALNGVAEAFVAATGTARQLRLQAIFWIICFPVFAAASWQFAYLGASGLVYANCVNLSLRLVWSLHIAVQRFGYVLARDAMPVSLLLLAVFSAFVVPVIAPNANLTSLAVEIVSALGIALATEARGILSDIQELRGKR